MNQSNSSSTPAFSTELAALRISGSDRVEFLQGQLTQDVSKITPEQPALAGWTSAKGRLLLVGWLIDWEDAYSLVVPAELAPKAAQRLQMFVLRAKVSIECVSTSITFTPETVSAQSSPEGKESVIKGCEITNKYYSFTPSAAHQGRLTLALEEPKVVAADPGARHWRAANLRAGLPSIFAPTQEHFVPQMLNLDLLGAISFTKGCYVGQEIVARTQNLGRIKRRMYGFTANQEAEPGATVYGDGKAIGEVVDAVTSGEQTQVLAVMRIEALANSTRVALDAEGVAALERRPLPYAVPEAVD